MTTNTLDSKTSGRMLNLLSNDATRIDNVLLYLPYFVIAPIQLACIVFLLVKKVDITYLAGLLVFVLYMPIQASTAKIFNYFRQVLEQLIACWVIYCGFLRSRFKFKN